MAKLILIRGIPGTGKTTLADKMVKEGKADVFFEADQWMTDKEGNYQFDPKRLPYCHGQCFIYAEKALYSGQTVIVSNTFTKLWEMERYLDMAKDLNVPVEVIELQTEYGSVHGVPEDKMELMRKRFEPYQQ